MTTFPDEIGPYRIEREIGRGGMGVVYLARDTRLDRSVAIKALPEDLAVDPRRLERFEREARTLAQLNHTNVAGIHGVEELDGSKYLVLEYVEGDTLADRLDRGALPPDEALELAIGVASGLAAAHDAGVIHRDLKPANIKITPEGKAKVLDFGLARTEESSSTSSGESVTRTSPVGHTPTIPGVILGTAAYMSPEQARGRRVDKRTDVWSFGVVLYEMLTGIGPFHGESASDSIGALLHKEIDSGRLPPQTPALVRHALARCLERDRGKRYRDIGDVRIELERARTEPEPVPVAAGKKGFPGALLLAVAIVFALAGSAAGWLLREEPTRELLRVSVPVPERFEDVDDFILSPDGRTLALVAREKPRGGETAQSHVYLRDLSSPEFRKVTGTERADWVSFSPDGATLLFAVNDELRPGVAQVRAVPLEGGPILTVHEFTQLGLLQATGDYASNDELLVLSRDGRELYRLATSGGTPELVAGLDLAPGDVVEDLHVVRGAGSLALATVSSAETNLIQRVDLDTGKMSTILENASLRAVFESGHIAFERDETLWVAPFDAKRARLTGPGQARLPDYSSVTWDRTGDRVLYEKKVDDGRNRRTIALLDSSGETVETLLDKPSNYFDLRLSPDGLRLAFRESGSGPARIWVLDISSGLARPVTPEEGSAGTPYWTHDGRIAFVRSAAGRNEIAAMSPTPGAAAENILPGTKEGTEIVNLQTFSPDARHVIIGGHVEGREGGLYLFDVGKGDSGRAFFASSFGEGGATFSPDGRWVAYQTNGTGRFEVYLRPFVADDPESAPIFPVTRQGGANPAWAPDGRTLYFFRSPGEGRPAALYRVAVEADPELSISEPEEVLPRVPGSIAVARDDRFIVAKPPEDLETSTDRSELHLLLNWNLGKDPE